jgi:hypothetical protein
MFGCAPEVVAQIKFLEWTDADQVRRTRLVGLRDDKNPFEVVKEHRRAFSARLGPAFDDLHPEYSCRWVGGNQTVAVNFCSDRSDGLGWTQWVPCRHDKHFVVRSGPLAPHPCIHQWAPSTRLARSIDDADAVLRLQSGGAQFQRHLGSPGRRWRAFGILFGRVWRSVTIDLAKLQHQQNPGGATAPAAYCYCSWAAATL